MNELAAVQLPVESEASSYSDERVSERKLDRACGVVLQAALYPDFRPSEKLPRSVNLRNYSSGSRFDPDEPCLIGLIACVYTCCFCGARLLLLVSKLTFTDLKLILHGVSLPLVIYVFLKKG